MELWQQRVELECAELQKKLDALRAFFNTEMFMQLPDKESTLLYRQERAMQAYVDVLVERMELFHA